MLVIRLSRIGKKNKPMYRLIISEKARDPYGKALEILGSYNPYTKDLQAKADRIKHWLSVGAGMSPSVNNLLIEKKIIEGEKVKASKKNKKKNKETEEEKKAPTPTDNSSEEKKPVSDENSGEKKEEVKENEKAEEKKVEENTNKEPKEENSEESEKEVVKDDENKKSE